MKSYWYAGFWYAEALEALYPNGDRRYENISRRLVQALFYQCKISDRTYFWTPFTEKVHTFPFAIEMPPQVITAVKMFTRENVLQ